MMLGWPKAVGPRARQAETIGQHSVSRFTNILPKSQLHVFQCPGLPQAKHIPKPFCIFHEAQLSWMSLLPTEPPMAR